MKLYSEEERKDMEAGTYQRRRRFPLSEIGQVLGGKFIDIVEREGQDYNRKFLRLETDVGIQEIYVNASLQQELNLNQPEVSQYLEIAYIGEFPLGGGRAPGRAYEIRLEPTIEETVPETKKEEKTQKKQEKKGNTKIDDDRMVKDLLERLEAIPEDLRNENIVEDTIGIHCTLNRLNEADTKRIKEKVLKSFS